MNYINSISILNEYRKSGLVRNSILALAVFLVIGLSSCAQQTQPSSGESGLSDAAQAVNSVDASDVTAASVGTTSGGSGMIFSDAMTLAQGNVIPDAIVKTVTNDTVHVVTVTRSKTYTGNGYTYSFNGTWTHTYTFYDANGNAMPKFIKGTTDKVVISSQGQHSITTPRVSLVDSSNGTWTISNLIAEPDSATLNGTLNRAGQTVKTASGHTFTHSFTMNWTNDTIVKVYDGVFGVNVTYLLGTGNSTFNATGVKDSSFERQISILYTGDGNATLTITRTSGNGKTDTITIDVKHGIWLRDIFLG
jgi:hypothetical protein